MLHSCELPITNYQEYSLHPFPCCGRTLSLAGVRPSQLLRPSAHLSETSIEKRSNCPLCKYYCLATRCSSESEAVSVFPPTHRNRRRMSACCSSFFRNKINYRKVIDFYDDHHKLIINFCIINLFCNFSINKSNKCFRLNSEKEQISLRLYKWDFHIHFQKQKIRTLINWDRFIDHTGIPIQAVVHFPVLFVDAVRLARAWIDLWSHFILANDVNTSYGKAIF